MTEISEQQSKRTGNEKSSDHSPEAALRLIINQLISVLDWQPYDIATQLRRGVDQALPGVEYETRRSSLMAGLLQVMKPEAKPTWRRFLTFLRACRAVKSIRFRVEITLYNEARVDITTPLYKINTVDLISGEVNNDDG